MISKIVMPPGGQTTNVSRVANWLVKIGDKVKRGDVLLEAETDKAVLSIESFASGVVIDILVPEGEDATEGEVLALIGSEQDAASYKADKPTGPESGHSLPSKTEDEDEYQPIMPDTSVKQVSPAPPSTARNTPAKYPAMPNAKKFAKEHGIDITTVIPANGEVVKRSDILLLVEQQRLVSDARVVEQEAYDSLPITMMRQVIAKRMLESVKTIPTYQVSVDVDMQAVIALRQLFNQTTKISYNDIIMRCLCAAIKSYPLINASYSDQEIRVFKDINIGIAVSLEGGLMVPVVKQANHKTILELAEASKLYVEKARKGALQPDEMTGGTITLSNLGMYPIDHFTAIINPPESCILAIGQIREQPVWKGNTWVPVPTAKITAAFDHRMIDGAYGAQFLSEFKRILENPGLAL